MASDVIDGKIAYLAGVLDWNKDGVLEAADIELWIERLAAIRGWNRKSEEYSRLEHLLLGAMETIAGDRRAADGRFSVAQADEALHEFAAAERSGLTMLAGGFFRLLDADGDGVIGRDEYRDLMGSIDVDQPVADEVFTRLDLNGDGHLSHDEFTALYLEFFCSDDPEAPGSWLWGPIP